MSNAIDPFDTEEGRIIAAALSLYASKTLGREKALAERLAIEIPVEHEQVQSGAFIPAGQVIDAIRVGVPETIGYGEQTKAAFSHGWRSSLDLVWQSLELSALQKQIQATEEEAA